MLVKKLVYAYITIIALCIYTIGVPYLHKYASGDLAAQSVSGSGEGMLSITFDDGWESQYTYALPILLKYHLNATFYVISGDIDTPQALTKNQVIALSRVGDNEIASHSVTHPDLTKLTPSQVDFELSQSKQDLEHIIGKQVTDFATPYGRFDSKNIALAGSYYHTIRSTESGYNDMQNTNPYNLVGMMVTSQTSLATIASWITFAQQTHTWLILIYHMTTVKTPYKYNVVPEAFDKQMQLVRESSLKIETINEGLRAVHINTNVPLDTCHSSACNSIIQGAESE